MRDARLYKYFAMAVSIVLIELATFQVLFLITRNYLLATVLSFIVAVVLNWIGGRKLVFGASHHHPVREFALVLIASVVGLAIQTGVVYTSVTVLSLYPLIGKGLSIIFSFFWNYFFRARFVYAVRTTEPPELPSP